MEKNDPKTVRFNDADNPHRLDLFEQAIERTAASSGKVLRQLADAYIRYVDEHGHSPTFPVALVPIENNQKPKRGKTSH